MQLHASEKSPDSSADAPAVLSYEPPGTFGELICPAQRISNGALCLEMAAVLALMLGPLCILFSALAMREAIRGWRLAAIDRSRGGTQAVVVIVMAGSTLLLGAVSSVILLVILF